MGTSLRRVPRNEKLEITRAVREKLSTRAEERKAKGAPPDTGYDEFVVELDDNLAALGPEVQGVLVADEVRVKRLSDLDDADDDVDYWYRLLESFVRINGLRRHGPHVGAMKKLYSLAFPDGLEHIDDAIADENRLCRASLAVLGSEEWAPVLAGVNLPTNWLAAWDTALTLSEKLDKEIADARTKRRGHVGSGRDAEVDWCELMGRFRKYVASRTKRSNPAQVAEALQLTAPITDALQKMAAADARRETEREKAEEAKKAEAAKKGEAGKKAEEPAKKAEEPAKKDG